MLRRGMSGQNVKNLQTAMNDVTNGNLKVDGMFGPNTETAVKRFQSMCHLQQDGVFGKESGKALLALTLSPQIKLRLQLLVIK
jgi:N-acetylmuramoyl-L-alanine amidase